MPVHPGPGPGNLHPTEATMRKTIVAVAAAILAAGCGVSKDEFAAKDLEAQQNLKKYQDESQKTADLQKKVADLQQQVAAKDQQIADLTKSAAQLEKEKGALQAKSAQYEQLAGSLKTQIAAGQIELSELRGRMTVKLKDKILFRSGSASIGADGKSALDAVADAFKDLKGKNVVVAGYTDDVPTGSKGSYKDNWDLSSARAISVVRYLQSKGVTPAMLGAAGFSEYRPLVPNDSAENRSQNRRIEIALTAADQAPVVESVKR